MCAHQYLPRGNRALRQVSKDYSLHISLFFWVVLQVSATFVSPPTNLVSSAQSGHSHVTSLLLKGPPHLFSSLREHSTIAPVIQSFVILSSFLVFYSRKVNLLPDNPSIDKSKNSQKVFLIFSENYGALAPVSTIANYHKLGSLKWQLFSHSSGSQNRKSRCWQAVFLTEVLEENLFFASPSSYWLLVFLHLCLHHMGKGLKTRF